MNDNSGTDPTAAAWASRLFARSPLKQRKFKQLIELLPDPHGKTCLDIGGDNGVISYLLRKRGGIWHSCDLSAESVAAIKVLVGERVERIDGRETPYPDAYFEVVVIVDFLEHIETDREFMQELLRIIKPGGTLIINVPNPADGIVRWLKACAGQTDAAHGHVRPGYSLRQLESLCGAEFEIEASRGYGRACSDFVDFCITLALDILKRGGRGRKGSIVTGQDLNRLKKSFKIYSFVYPLLALFVKLDALLWFLPANMLIVRATKSCSGYQGKMMPDPAPPE